MLADILGGGGGARRNADGDDGIDPYTSNCAILPAEIAELEYPWLIERTELVDGSGGTGRHRGGMGIRRDYRLLATASDGMFYVEQTDLRFCASGRDGDGPGAPLYAAVHNTFVVVTSRFAAPPPWGDAPRASQRPVSRSRRAPP